MCELTRQAESLETKLRDLDCDTIAITLEVSLRIYNESLLERQATAENVDRFKCALSGAVLLAESVVEHLSLRARPHASDGDVHLGPYSWAPGRTCEALRDAISAAEREAKDQRDQLLMPVVKSMIANAQRDELEHLGVSVQ